MLSRLAFRRLPFKSAGLLSRYASTATASTSTISPLQKYKKEADQYEKDGYAIVRNAIDKDLVQEMSDHVDFISRRYEGIPTQHWHHLIMVNDCFWTRIITDNCLLDIAQGVGQSFLSDGNIGMFSTHYFNKLPGPNGIATLWHADGLYWPLEPMEVLTLWVAVDRSDRENGCLRVVKGTHIGNHTLKPDLSIKNTLGQSTHTDEEIEREKVVDLELNPGDVSIHHANIVHGSEANKSNRRRCGLTIRYISTRTKCTEPTQPVMLMRGKPVPGINEYHSWPKYRPGYDMPFKGCNEWNAKRYINPRDEPYYNRTDYNAIEKDIKDGLWKFIDQLGGR